MLIIVYDMYKVRKELANGRDVPRFLNSLKMFTKNYPQESARHVPL